MCFGKRNPRTIRIWTTNLVLQILKMLQWASKLPQNSIFLEQPKPECFYQVILVGSTHFLDWRQLVWPGTVSWPLHKDNSGHTEVLNISKNIHELKICPSLICAIYLFIRENTYSAIFTQSTKTKNYKSFGEKRGQWSDLLEAEWTVAVLLCYCVCASTAVLLCVCQYCCCVQVSFFLQYCWVEMCES